MPCYDPRRVITLDGHIRWDRDWRFPQHKELRLNIPCRLCIGCRQAQGREWSIRCFHEALAHTTQWRDPKTHVSATIPNASVITLTYNDDHLPDNLELKHDDFQRFMMRLRRDSPGLRVFMCGEYGGKTARPHYHALIFGRLFDDQYSEQSADRQINKMSYHLNDLWSQRLHPRDPPTLIGRATVDDFTFAGAAYVAGYVAKKYSIPHQTGPITHTVETSTGEIHIDHPAPEYRQMSRRPGLGRAWITNPQNMERTYAEDHVQIQEWKFHPPKYYDSLFKSRNPEGHARLSSERAARSDSSANEWDHERCANALAIAHSDMAARADSL